MKPIPLGSDSEIFTIDRDIFKFQSHSFTVEFFDMWQTQGKTFWLRFLLVLRQKFQAAAGTLLYPSYGNICLQQYLRTIDYCFICIHKRFIEQDGTSATIFISNVSKILILVRNSFLNDISKSLFDKDRARDLFKRFTGVVTPYDRKSFFKELDLVALYKSFYMSLVNVEKAFFTVSVNPTDDNEFQQSGQHWIPFPNWSNKDFKPLAFERHLAKIWGNELPNMLLFPNADVIFSAKSKHECVVLNTKNLAQLKKYFFQHIKSVFDCFHCQEHSDCKLKILHSKNCESPLSCKGSVYCTNICETELNNLQKDGKLHEDFLKCFDCTSFPTESNQKFHVSIQTKISDNQVSTFKRKTLNFYNLELQKVMCYYGKSFCDGSMRSGSVKSRLKDKLREKKLKHVVKNHPLSSSAYSDNAYCNMLYKKAKKRFQKELSTKVPYSFVIEHKSGCFDSESDCSDTEKEPNPAFSNKRCFGTDCAEISSGKIESISLEQKSIPEKDRKDQLPETEIFFDVCSTKNSSAAIASSNPTFELKTPKYESDTKAETADVSMTVEPNHVSLNIDVMVKSANVKTFEVDQVVKFEEAPEDGNVACCEHSKDEANVVCERKDLSNKVREYFEIIEGQVQVIKGLNGNSDEVQHNNSVSLNGHSKDIYEAENKPVVSKDDTEISSEEKFETTDNSEKKTQEEICDEFLSLLGTAKEKLFSLRKENNTRIKDKKDRRPKSNDLQACAFCFKKETERRSFLKCALCKRGRFKEQRYYCSKDCQSDDWGEIHRNEHKNNKLM